MIRIAVTGGRSYVPTRREMETFWQTWQSIVSDSGGRVVGELHHGGATGVDSLLATAVKSAIPDMQVIQHKANWAKYGKSAGPIRNKSMLENDGNTIDALIAFKGNAGTASCITIARSLGIRVYEIGRNV